MRISTSIASYIIVILPFFLNSICYSQNSQEVIAVPIENKEGSVDVIVGSIQEILNDAEEAKKIGDYKTAEACYKAVIEYSPQNARLHVDLANLYRFGLGLFEQAIKEYKIAESLSGDNKKGIGFCQEMEGQIYLNDLHIPKEAVSEFEKSLDSNLENINNIPLLFNLAVALNKVDRGEEAENYLKKIIELNPESDFAYVSRGQLLTNSGDYEGAINALIKAKQITSNKELTVIADSAIDIIKNIRKENTTQ